MFHDIMIAFICIGTYAILILYGIRLTENRNMLPIRFLVVELLGCGHLMRTFGHV